MHVYYQCIVLFAFLIPEQIECMHASYHESTQVSCSKIRISLTFLIKVNDTELHMVNCICFLSGGRGINYNNLKPIVSLDLYVFTNKS